MHMGPRRTNRGPMLFCFASAILNRDASWVLDCEGQSLLESLLYAAHLTDWISIALALIQGIDPSAMASIDGLKAHLASIQ